jgi:gamma-glutamyltranspeptidase
MAEHGGLITQADLDGYQPLWSEPISTTYRGRWRVSTGLGRIVALHYCLSTLYQIR